MPSKIQRCLVWKAALPRSSVLQIELLACKNGGKPPFLTQRLSTSLFTQSLKRFSSSLNCLVNDGFGVGDADEAGLKL